MRSPRWCAGPGSQPPGTEAVAGDLTDAAGARPRGLEAHPARLRHPPGGRDRLPARRRPGSPRSTSRARAGCWRPAPPPAGRSSCSPPRSSPATPTARAGRDLGAPGRDRLRALEAGGGEAGARVRASTTRSFGPATCTGPGAGSWRSSSRACASPAGSRSSARATTGGTSCAWRTWRPPCADAAERAPSGALYHVVDDEPIRFYDFVALAAERPRASASRRAGSRRRVARLVAGAEPVLAVTRSARSSNAGSSASWAGSRGGRRSREGVPDAVAREGPDLSA